jgi:hypothetical protein
MSDRTLEARGLEQALARDGHRWWRSVFDETEAAAHASWAPGFRATVEWRERGIIVRAGRGVVQITRADNPPVLRLATFRPILQTVDLPLTLNTNGAIVAEGLPPGGIARLVLKRLNAVNKHHWRTT